jgi:hypothetical protein
MEDNLPAQPPSDQQEAELSETPPKRDPKKAAGSLNPKEKTAFYEAVVKKPGKRLHDR